MPCAMQNCSTDWECMVAPLDNKNPRCDHSRSKRGGVSMRKACAVILNATLIDYRGICEFCPSLHKGAALGQCQLAPVRGLDLTKCVRERLLGQFARKV